MPNYLICTVAVNKFPRQEVKIIYRRDLNLFHYLTESMYNSRIFVYEHRP